MLKKEKEWSGEVYMIYLDNQFPILLCTYDIPIRSLDINFIRKRLAFIDDNYDISAIDLPSKGVV